MSHPNRQEAQMCDPILTIYAVGGLVTALLVALAEVGVPFV